MNVTLEQIIPLVHNVQKTEIDERKRLRFMRFTPRQIENYGLDGERFAERCRASANVTLDFITDAEWFGFEYDVQTGSHYSFYSFDLFVDGILEDSHTIEGFASSAVLFNLPMGSHRVTLFFPWSAEVMLKSMSVSENSVFRPVPAKELRILAIGDSCTQGYIAKHPGYCWAGKMTRELDAEVLNLGIAGYGFMPNSLKERIDWKADLVILAYGSNDFNRHANNNRESYCRCVSAYMSRFAEMFPDTPVLQLPPIVRYDLKHLYREKSKGYNLEDACRIIRDIAASYPQITVMENIGYPHAADFFASDHIHPNDLGFQLYGEAVIQAAKDKLCRI